MELYKKHRPRSLDTIVGNTATVEALRNLIQRNTLPHTLLFLGPSGCGKTTLARIVQRELKCDPMDLREMDSASYRGIDSVRDIRTTMQLSPIGSCRVWILDEVHKWTNDAQNASLKMLEDTPKHVYFLLCTTDADKLIKAVRSRCTEMPVSALTYDELTKLVRRVMKKENIDISNDHVEELVIASEGSARRALVLLEKLVNVGESKRDDVIKTYSETTAEVIELCRALLERSTPWAKICKLLKGITEDAEAVRWAVLGYMRTVLLNKENQQAYFVIQAFSSPFYDSKQAGLVAACYEVIKGD